MGNKKAILLCGDSKGPLDDTASIACLSPLRHLALSYQGVRSVRFFDYKLSETDGEVADHRLQASLENALSHERQLGGNLRWAPLAYQHVLWRLSRYVSLKRCLERFLIDCGADEIWVSSSADADIVAMASAVTQHLNIGLSFGDGVIDGLGSVNYCIDPSGLPTSVDPLWLVWLQARLWKWRLGAAAPVLLEGWQVSNNTKSVFATFRRRVWVDLLGVLAERFQNSRNRWMRVKCNLERPVAELVRTQAWQGAFSADEVAVANAVLERFVAAYPPEFLDHLITAYAMVFSVLRPTGVVLSHDQSDYARCISYASHRAGVPAIYMPHGIVFEDYSGVNAANPFAPDGMLAWSSGSRQRFEQLGWPTEVAHQERYAFQWRDYRPLPSDRRAWKVLVLMSEWVGITAAGREDCAAHDLIEVTSALLSAGVPIENVVLKYHSASPAIKFAKQQLLDDFFNTTGMCFQVADPSANSMDLMVGADLVVTMLTSGILEAVVLGVPLVIFGLSGQRIGSLSGCGLPEARDSSKLAHLLESFDNDAASAANKRVQNSLRTGQPLEDVVSAWLRNYRRENKGETAQ